MIHKKAKTDLLRSASKATIQHSASKRTHKEPIIPLGLPLRSHTGVGEDRDLTDQSGQLPECNMINWRDTTHFNSEDDYHTVSVGSLLLVLIQFLGVWGERGWGGVGTYSRLGAY